MRSPVHPAVTRLLGLLLLLTSTAALAQADRDADKTITQVPVVLETSEKDAKQPTGVAMIGMEAYREVLASGRYVVGPGDEFVVYTTGMEQPVMVKVMAEGGLLIPGVGSVRVAGSSLKTAREAMAQAYRQAFRQGQITVELNQLRVFPVTVVGVVGSPGVTVTSGVERISEVLRKAGGLGGRASRRNIRVAKTSELTPVVWEQLRSADESGDYEALEQVTRRVDLELFGVTGDSRYNPFAEDGDLVIVPPQGNKVGMVGAVQREGFFEYAKGDRVSDLLTLAQGLSPGYDPATGVLFRYSEDRSHKISLPLDLAGIQAGDPDADLRLESEDWVVVRHFPGMNQKSTVRVIGQVLYPGFYVVERTGTSLKQVIEWAGGFTEDASLSEAQVVRAREGDQKNDPEMERIASIPVGDRTEDDDQYFIMKSREKRGHMVVDFVALFEQGNEAQNITLLPDDVIIVPASQRTVVVSGQAAHPGAVIYNESYTVWDYIQRAGGLGWRASKDIRVIKARTGEMRRARDAGQMEPGDRIWIKERPQRDYWAIFTQTMGVIGQVSTIVLLYATLTN
ncbi:MAG: SLBB domain-containing protein [Candidatus Latescibacterota bacterium]|jgi:protein involved in polysaccharide export with SLBB domain